MWLRHFVVEKLQNGTVVEEVVTVERKLGKKLLRHETSASLSLSLLCL
ncbi:unnamed protein product [Brassica napus]|uniref:(rape) hypothetical protein n=1 Tax=Brassica napus TaxID=3708 RepID=A0A816X9F2_BRANA|nr:unnamed protein product [Brassica napus]